MNDDLINKLKYISNNPLINGEYDEENYLFDDEAQILLDYITNLQEENKRLKENAEHNDKVVDKARWNEMIYKSRNKKAIELLKEAGCYDEETKTFCDDVWEELPKLLDILEGEDKDER